MENRINNLFKKKQCKILSVFYTAGFPKLEDTVPIAQYLEQAGVDLMEIGIPFSDPVADGPVIQDTNTAALKNGMTLKKLLGQVGEIRKTVKLPIILMGYVNPVLQYGVEKFCKEAAAAGVDGIILPDLPIDEYVDSYKATIDSQGLSIAFLISPTTSEERIRKIDAISNGFIYAVSASSTTGVKGEFSAEQEAYFKKLQSLKLKSPFLIGFGISGNATFSKACQYASGAIIGSAFIEVLRNSPDQKKGITDFITALTASP